MAVDLPNAFTLLTMTGIGVAPYSARGLRQTLEPIPQAMQTRRTVNGDLVDLSIPKFRKFQSTITGSDQLSPALNGIWPGHEVTVECIVELAYAGTGTPDRTVVTGSTRVEQGITYYRPVLNMRVIGYAMDEDEYGRAVSWTITLEEV